MRKDFSVYWIASKQPRKQRKYKARAPLHIKHGFLAAHLSKELRKKYQRRSFPLRKGDTVKIMRGSFTKKTGKIENVDSKRTRVNIEKMQKAKKDGTKVNIFFHPSNLQIQELNLDDKERINSIERKIKKTEEKKVTKQEKKQEENKEKKN